MDPVSLVLGIGGKILDKFFPDPVKKAEAQVKLMEMAQRGELEGEANQVKVLITEMQGSWLQRNWRPMLMTLFGSIIANNYIIAPYAGAIFGDGARVVLELPPMMWELIKLGMGGYVLGRSAEKVLPMVAKALKG